MDASKTHTHTHTQIHTHTLCYISSALHHVMFNETSWRSHALWLFSCFRQETTGKPSSKLQILTKVRDTLFFLVGDCYFVKTKMD